MKFLSETFVNHCYKRNAKSGLRINKRIVQGYLRRDIHCGIVKCKLCTNTSNTNEPVLDQNPKTDSTVYSNYYIVPDTETLFNQIDIFEDESVENVIICMSVLKLLQSRSSVIYKRILDVAANVNRKFYIYDDQHSEFTYVERSLSKLKADHKKLLLKSTLSFYVQHVQATSKSTCFVVLTRDEELENAFTENKDRIHFCKVEDYIQTLNASKGVLEIKLRVKDDQAKRPENFREIFPPYLTNEQLFTGIRRGDVLQGTFRVSGHNFLEGYVTVDSFDKPILISGYKRLNRAIDGDVVGLKLLPKEEWLRPVDIVVEDDADATLEELEQKTLEETQKNKEKSDKDCVATGQIVGIIRRKHGQCCGIIMRSQRFHSSRHLFIPADRKYPRVRIDTNNIDNLVGKKLIIAYDDWPLHSRYPFGHFVRIIGEAGDKNVENEVLLLEHDVPYASFSQSVLRDLPAVPWIITDEDRAKRVDLRDLNICSVDPPGCTDIDDALHCFKNPDGTFNVGVHIADVSHFVRPNTAIDAEAKNRGTTVYLVDRRIDMVPELLSSDLCSLRENVERFAFSCVWALDKNAKILNTTFHKSIIKSRNSFTYEEAQLRIDDKSKQDDITKSLRYLNQLAKILKRERLANGALVLSSPEVKFHVDSETHDPIDVNVKVILDTMSMIEEFMLLANISVAKKIYEDFPECAVLRRHPEPPVANFEPLVKAAQSQGITIKIGSGKELADSLNRGIKKDNPDFNNMLRILATRCMQQAVYFSSGMFNYKEYFHYGLAVEIYTHFTSPIRRYADIMVHRLLAATIGADTTYPELLDNKISSKICDNLNFRNRMAQYAGRASVALNTHRFFKNKVFEEVGNILFVRKNALQVLIPKFGLEGTVFLEPPPGYTNDNKRYYPKFEYNEELQIQTSSTGIQLKAFDKVVIRLEVDSTNIQREKIVFSMIQPLAVGLLKTEVDKVLQETTKNTTATATATGMDCD
ncbi:exosome complex exonuclease RRP44 [Chrysoperla carnea]|uniref:exosome complex exonuclease RRP44 n=1 Tax=Chrysoperla carnea TaxID=189513 RepID=UPI001D063AF5|nr:exosome complex exonuclease RRP44 [Chrysoperla carnea]